MQIVLYICVAVLVGGTVLPVEPPSSKSKAKEKKKRTKKNKEKPKLVSTFSSTGLSVVPIFSSRSGGQPHNMSGLGQHSVHAVMTVIMTLYAAECRRLIGRAISPGSSSTNTISATSTLLSLATWTSTTDRIIMRFGETTFPLSPLDHPVSIRHRSLCIR